MVGWSRRTNPIAAHRCLVIHSGNPDFATEGQSYFLSNPSPATQLKCWQGKAAGPEKITITCWLNYRKMEGEGGGETLSQSGTIRDVPHFARLHRVGFYWIEFIARQCKERDVIHSQTASKMLLRCFRCTLPEIGDPIYFFLLMSC